MKYCCLRVLLLCLVFLSPLMVPASQAQYGSAPGKLGGEGIPNAQDAVIKKVRFDQKLNSQVPLDARFRSESGKIVDLKTLGNGKPIVLAIVFFECRTLCSEIINETVRGLKDVQFKPDEQFEVVILSMNPRETPALASEKKRDYMKLYGRAGTEGGWHFLTGTKDQIDRVANAIGYGYAYDAKSDQYAHPNGIVMLTPHGKVTRYFYGLTYPPRDLKFGLMDASHERIGSPVEQLLLTCFHYDPQTGRYNASVMGVVRFAGALTVLALVCMVFMLSRRDRKTLPALDELKSSS
jgi:protein SCO1/2